MVHQKEDNTAGVFKKVWEHSSLRIEGTISNSFNWIEDVDTPVCSVENRVRKGRTSVHNFLIEGTLNRIKDKRIPGNQRILRCNKILELIDLEKRTTSKNIFVKEILRTVFQVRKVVIEL